LTDTALDHPLVQAYLVTLDEALRRLPVAQARELREQLTAHLNEVLPPGAGDDEVRSVLRQLGRPADLVAEAVAATGTVSPGAALSDLGAAVRLRLTQVRRRTWLVAALGVVAAAAAVIRMATFLGASPLAADGLSSWWYAQDISQQTEQTAGLITQVTVPARFGQRQGYVIGIYNPSDVAQTITGYPHGSGIGPDNPGGAQITQIGVSVGDPAARSGEPRSLRYTLPGVIPPHQYRLVRVLWVTGVCLERNSTLETGQLALQVRVGWFSRTETIALNSDFALAGPSTVPCSNSPEPHRT